MNTEAMTMTVRAESLRRMRRLISGYGRRWALPDSTVQRVVLVAHELAVNAIRHGGGCAWLRLWRSGQLLCCQVRDAGPGLAEPEEAGRLLPSPDHPGGRGLWLVRRLSAHLHISSRPGDGTTVTASVPVTTSPER